MAQVMDSSSAEFARKEHERRRREAELQKQSEANAAQFERDKRTVFVYKLHPRVTEEMLTDFFGKAGAVRDVSLIVDKNGRSKGMGFVEFYDPSAILGAIALRGIELMGHPIEVKPSEAEKTHQYAVSGGTQGSSAMTQSSSRLYVGGLHPKFTKDDVEAIFAEVGPVERVELETEAARATNRGFGFIKFRKHEDAKKALSQIHGMELLGHKLKLGLVSEGEDTDETSLNARGRAALMAKLQVGAAGGPAALTAGQANPVMALTAPPGPNGLSAPLPNTGATLAPSGTAPGVPSATYQQPPPNPTTSDPCLCLCNLFDPSEETDPDFDQDIKEDVCAECVKYGQIVHIYVDPKSAGQVFVKMSTVEAAQQIINSLNRRWFARRMITVEPFSAPAYNSKFGLS